MRARDGVYLVGVIADTHGLVRPGIAGAFDSVDLILHAGDVGGPAVFAALSAIAPTEAVYGNVDDPHDPSLARERSVTVGGVSIHVSHGHELGRHKSIVVRDEAGRIAMNPGAAGPRRFQLPASVARLTIRPGAEPRVAVEIISLA
jgi:hypothetical protein